MSTASTVLDKQSRMFDGVARVFLFEGVAISEDTKPEAFLNGNFTDIGKIVDGSPAWAGEDGTEIKDTEGGIILARPGNMAFTLRIPHSEQAAKILGATEGEVGTLTEGSSFGVATGTKVIRISSKALRKLGIGVGIFNDDHKELALFPKADLTAKLGITDNLWQYEIKVVATEINYTNLNTINFIPLTKSPV